MCKDRKASLSFCGSSFPLIIVSLLFLLAQGGYCSQENWTKDTLLYEENFDSESLDNWKIELQKPDVSVVEIQDGKLNIDVGGGATIWFKHKLNGDVLIEYDVTVIKKGGANGRVSDLNQFWMASDPVNTNLFTRSGKFSQYDNLRLYYVGMGGNNNSTTRFRRYPGGGERPLLAEYTDADYLLEPNTNYHIKIICLKGLTQFIVNGEVYFNLKDPDPLVEGNFGFRTVRNHETIDNFTVYRLVESKATDPSDLNINGVRTEKLKWFRDAKLGLFIHWGPSSLKGVEISWARQDHPFDHPGKGEKIPNEEYDNLYKSFNPVKFDAKQWMKLAKKSGFKYVVFTSKHHDGFSMWHTKLRDYNIANTPFKRDICKELADAAHKYGLKLGWYYSTRDWTHPDYLVGDNKKYNDFYEGQVRELLTDFGKVDIMWFDHVAGNWGDYTIPQLFEMMYELQGENLLVNNRAAKFIKREKGKQYEPDTPALKKLVLGDYDTPEQRIGKFQADRAWESCMTMTKCKEGGGWSYRPDGTTISYKETIQRLVHTVTGDGNLLLNVGPLPTGEFPADQVAILKKMGTWLKQNGKSIYETRGGPLHNGPWGGMTQKGNRIYVHVLNWPEDGSPLVLPALEKKIIHSNGLNVKKPTVKQTSAGTQIELSAKNRDEIDSIIVLETE